MTCSPACRRTGYPADAVTAANLPAISIVFAAFLGYNPIVHLVGSKVLGKPPAHQHQVLTGHSFFPHLISGSFASGLHDAFLFAIVACPIAAIASWSSGGNPQTTGSGPAQESDGGSAVRDAGLASARELVRG